MNIKSITIIYNSKNYKASIEQGNPAPKSVSTPVEIIKLALSAYKEEDEVIYLSRNYKASIEPCSAK